MPSLEPSAATSRQPGSTRRTVEDRLAALHVIDLAGDASVGAGSAAQPLCTASGLEEVVSSTAAEGVASTPALEDVVAIAPAEHVVSARPVDRVVASSRMD